MPKLSIIFDHCRSSWWRAADAQPLGAHRRRGVIVGRELRRQEIEKVWSIDRSEVIDNIYTVADGELALKPDYFNVRGWPPGEAEIYTPILVDCYDRGGWLYGLFDDAILIGVTILESKFIGANRDRLQLKFLHVSRAYRGQGLGRRLFELTKVRAGEKGAKGLYISATPSEHTINFYRRLGCVVTRETDAELFALEPDDIHLECGI
jgi:predicted N-acetyltransferase YhbS